MPEIEGTEPVMPTPEEPAQSVPAVEAAQPVEPVQSPVEAEQAPTGFEAIRLNLTLDSFDSATVWTEQGGATQLEEKANNFVAEIVRKLPTKAVITFEQLPDGGYEIKTYQKR